jgi:hypothetical protein
MPGLIRELFKNRKKIFRKTKDRDVFSSSPYRYVETVLHCDKSRTDCFEKTLEDLANKEHDFSPEVF